MARKRKEAKARGSERRSPLLLVLVALAGGAAFWLVSRSSKVVVPDPDRSAMEPQVAEKIRETREKVLATPDGSEAWGLLGTVFQAHALPGEAASCYRKAIELAPTEFRWRYLLAHALRDSDPEGALAAASEASSLKPDYAPTYVFRAQLLEARNENDRALELYEKAFEIDPQNAMAEFGTGRLYLARGEAEEALPHLLRARDLAGEAAAIHGALAQAYRQTGDMESALRENRIASQTTETLGITDPIHYAMRKESVSSIALLERALEAERAGDDARAESLYRELVALRPDDTGVRARFGEILARQNKLALAKEQFEEAIRLDAGLARAHYGLGNVLNFEGDYDGAAAQYRAALDASPDHARALVNLAGILAFQGKLDEAASLCRRALEADPKAFATNLQLGQVLSQKRSYREAIPYLQAAIEARPDSGPAHRQLSLALIAVGDLPGAWKHVERARELGDPLPPALVEELRRRVPAS